MRLTAHNLVREIGKLPRDVEYQYINEKNQGKIVIHAVYEPEGPIEFRRYNPAKGETLASKKIESISVQMLWRLANALAEDKPVNIDRVFGGSYNTRSVLETLLAHTSQFYWCKPGRIELINTSKSVKPGHKHLIYMPDNPHALGVTAFADVNMQISEFNMDVVYKGIDLTATPPPENMTIEQKRRHAQIQIALVKIGQHLGFRTWIAANDKGIEYAGQRIDQMEGVIDSLAQERVISAYPEAARAARLIDCIWFRNGRLMPAVMEVEHTTGVTSGLTRMKGFYDLGPALQDVRWTIVAPDEDRAKVIAEANREQFRDMNTRFFSYSAVEELYSLCERRKPTGITEKFLDCFMEPCIH
ncbi:restriction endonuclease [Hafnia sp. HMSC23F03]|uniref:restriction endonuclease n=1 Tax=Hafnia sp. HMSC23F03 TaxID=1581059 RepID=UPI0008A1EFF7|nr:restriction endonuclease [Hafnia sp. HMSC23F03]OFS11324.1 restriction endonuclease [Hafnia sp. HMSC23F03]